MDFPEFFQLATESEPYPWQTRVAEIGLPEVIDIETGAGKTAGLVLGWLYRLRNHPDEAVRQATPAWLVFALPMRSLVDQTERSVRRWVDALGDIEVSVHRLLGGEGRIDGTWRDRPGRPTVIVGTVDMILSRQLMRGYASSRWMWPVEFGLLHTGCHLVFDEVQLLGPALPTSRQLDAFRGAFGTAAPCSTTWMSATLDRDRLRTVDNPHVPTATTLQDDDRDEGLARRLDATRLVAEVDASDSKAMASTIAEQHRRGTLTLAVVNTVKRAQETFAQVRRRVDADGPDVMLLHGRYRPVDRAAIVDRALDSDVPPEGRILVATQVVEAGVDISAATLVTDVAPWSSIVQRAGRCNRAGEIDDARLFWSDVAKPAPYLPDDMTAASTTLRSFEGKPVTTTTLRELGQTIAEVVPIVPVLRRRDLVDLFDTSPDLVGNDIDVARFIRADGDTDVQVAWRHVESDEDGRRPFAGGRVRPDELCRVSIGRARAWLKGVTRAWTPDHLADGGWRRVDANDLRPGVIVVVDAEAGGYDPVTGWDGTTKRPVPVVANVDNTADSELAPTDESTDDDPATFSGAWVTLGDHLTDAEREASALLDEVRLPGLSPADRRAVVRAAALHDLGKAHDVFQETLAKSAPLDQRAAVDALVPLAKSAGTRPARHRRRHFRHELVSALMLGTHAHALLEGEDADLVRYLVAAHHGRVRLAIRSVPGELAPHGSRTALGVVEGDVVDAFTIMGVDIGPTELALDAMELGGDASWTAMALGLRDRADLGPFRLATLEALTRLADWRASERPAVTRHLVREVAS